MKTLILSIFALFVLIQLSKAQEPTKEHKVVLNESVSGINDSANYELLIIDPGFESWLITQAKPMGYHSQSYLENWNRQYVTEWNYRFTSGMNPDIIESSVDYDSFTNYGLELNYKLYNYFIFVEITHQMQLIQRAGY